MYGNNGINKKYEHLLNRQFLHSNKIEFTFFKKKYKFEADLQNDLKDFLEYLK